MDYNFTKPYSEKTAELIDNEVKQIIQESYVRAEEVLKQNMSGLTELAELLLEKEVIFSEDLERIFGKRIYDKKREAENPPEKLTDKKDKKEIPEVLPGNTVSKSQGKKISAASEKEGKESAKPAKKVSVKDKM
jgi:cell division protease FtsH